MRKIITLLFLAAFCICSQAYSQNRADELMKQAQENLAKKEYIKARYLFLQAYNAFSSQAKYDKAWNVVSMPALSIIGKTIIKKLLNYCAVPNY